MQFVVVGVIFLIFVIRGGMGMAIDWWASLRIARRGGRSQAIAHGSSYLNT